MRLRCWYARRTMASPRGSPRELRSVPVNKEVFILPGSPMPSPRKHWLFCIHFAPESN